VEFCLAAESCELLELMKLRVPWETATGVDARGAASEFALHRTAGRYRLTIDCKGAAESDHLESVLDELARGLILHVAELSPDCIFVHAGVVAWHGCALMLPGASFAGKTTLVAELVRAGATYYSDEYAVLDAEGTVHPYARELAMRREGSTTQTPTHVDALGGICGSGAVRVSHVLFTEYVKGAAWRPEPISPGMAALEMLRHAVPVQRTPARVMATLATMLGGAKALRSHRGEAGETAQALLAMMAVEEAPA
jgi:hypothetical protein